MIDVIVPVYRGLSETQACLNSVLGASNKSPLRLIVINDCSPEPEISQWLREQAAMRPMVLLENEVNLGFVATVNRGMSLSETNDVVLLNSDTEVANNWLDRLSQAAAAPSVGTVTPFSNNATICSYPGFCQDNELPDGLSIAQLDTIFAEANPRVVIDIPTAVGFCMYIRRETLKTVGLFDVERFGKGYGEENDFCCRAQKAGYRNVLATDVFVWHKGNVSFGDSHNERKQKCLEVLQELHPQYIPDVHRHIQADPAREARLRASLLRWQRSGLPRLLFVTHDRGGGTEQHCRELADLLAGKALIFHLAADATSITDAQAAGVTTVKAYSRGEIANLHFVLPQEYPLLVETMKHIGICRVHFHHTIRVDNSVWNIARDIGVPQDFTGHDYYPMCPQVTLTDENNRYCGELGEQQCNSCLHKRPIFGRPTIQEWRKRYAQLLQTSERVIVPAKSVGERYRRYFDLKSVVVAEHPDSLRGWHPTVAAVAAPPGRPIRVAVLGALSPMKGPDVLEEAVLDARQHNLPITYKLFGYAYRALAEGDRLEVHGKYDSADLQGMLQDWQPDLVWFPALWPETYSYTLSECLTLGLPVLASDLGALSDRLENRAHSWVFPWHMSGKEWNERIIEVNQHTVSEKGAHSHATDSANFYLASYLVSNWQTNTPVMQELPSVEMLRKTRYRELNKRQLSKLKTLEWFVTLRGHPAMAWLAKRIPMSWQRHIKNRLLSR